ncbi:uncharacterized protein LOC119375434 [Rhipicephalus sanguineus]|uniref:uncharacterized protein LOC119375434 n=1 Tax=Rhipicephalus sanguineus TaxID=34632 RepID=UPI00189544CC|nr:uncharacterized protein LOC119375434 [Rhipicephalus sanguineus]
MRLPLEKTVTFLKDSGLSLLPADKEGGFAVLPKGEYLTKAQEAIGSSFDKCSNVCLSKQQFIQDNVAIETETGDDHLMKVLGVPWEHKGDTTALTVRNAASFATNSPATKRTILQTVARVYDPLGYLSPFTVKGKLIFQDLWKRKHSWDDTLPDEVQAAWNAWCAELPEVQAQIPRYVFLHDSSVELAFELHIFTDASPKAYGACIYVRALSADGPCVTRLLISRSRVAPLKTMSLPRLELIACVSGARLAEYVRSVPLLQQASARFWTDSLVALHWIRAKTRNRDLISNRVAEISKLTNPDTWAHCSSGENPADLLTRGVSAKALLESDKWWHGPPWISTPGPIPSFKLDDLPNDRDNEPLFETATTICPSLVSSRTSIVRAEDFSSLNRLLRVTAFVQRFVHNASRRSPPRGGTLTTLELEEAERYWLRLVQDQYFRAETRFLEKGKKLPSTSSVLRLAPILDTNGLLRVGGRLDLLNASPDIRHPILLSAEHKFTTLIVQAAHARTLHGGIELTLTELRCAIDAFDTFLRSIELTLAASKIEALLSTLELPPVLRSLNFLSVPVPRGRRVCYLGATIDHRISWQPAVKELRSVLKSSLASISATIHCN